MGDAARDGSDHGSVAGHAAGRDVVGHPAAGYRRGRRARCAAEGDVAGREVADISVNLNLEVDG